MKSYSLPVCLLLVIVVNSCVSYHYYLDVRVGENLGVQKTAYSDERGTVRLDTPFDVDFHDKVVKMTYVSDDVPDSLGFNPEESLDRRFRWFYTYYEYKAVFGSIRDMLPFPCDDHMTKEQQQLFFRGGNVPEGWNGIEMYLLLDDVNKRFADWYADAVFFTMCDIFEPYCTEGQIEVLNTCKADFMGGMQKEKLFMIEPGEFEERLVQIAPDKGFGSIYSDNNEAVDKSYAEVSGIADRFSYSFIYSVRMPGRWYEGNAVDFIDGAPVWKIDAYRLMCDDLVLEAVTRKVNIWAFVLTFAIIAFLLQVFAKLFSKK